MTMHIYIPSRGRAHLVGVGTSATLRYISREWLPRTTYVVPSAEAAAYRRKLNNASLEMVKIIECDEQPISRKRLWIAKQHEGKEIGMLDDDLQFLSRTDTTTTKTRISQSTEFNPMMDWVMTMLRDNAHVSVSDRQGNGHMGPGDRETLVSTNTRSQRALFYRTKDYLSMKHDRVPVMEDFDINLQLLRAGLPNIVSFWWTQGQHSFDMEGGCSTYRTLEMHNAAAHELVRLHPGLVKLRTKTTKTKANSTGSTTGLNRVEVTISWKKAFEESKS